MDYTIYELVRWPEVQRLTELPWFREECYLLQALSDQKHIDSAWFVPKQRLDELQKMDTEDSCDRKY
jgi:hypothetical protein